MVDQKNIIDVSKLESVEVDGIDTNDYPDFCDAFISYAEMDGIELTEDQLDEVNENSEFIHEKVYEQLF